VSYQAGKRSRSEDTYGDPAAPPAPGKKSLVDARYGGSGEAAAPAPASAPAGPGLEALAALMAAGTPEPIEVVRLIDAHRGDRDAILAVVRARLGDDYAAQVIAAADRLRLDLDRRELVAGDPADPDGGYFLASQEEKGARWRTEGGRFEGKLDKEGLTSRYSLDDDSAVRLGVAARRREATLGWEEDGDLLAEGFARYQSKSDLAYGVRAPFDLGEDRTLTGELRREHKADGSASVLAGTYRDPSTTVTGHVGHHESGRVIGGLSASHRLDDRTELSGNVSRTGAGDVIGGIGATHKLDDRTRLSASAALEAERMSASLSASHQATPQLALSGRLGHTRGRDGSGGVTTLTLSERYRSPDLIHGLDFTATTGEHDKLRGVGSVEGRLGPRLYGGAFSSFTAERGADPEAAIGASLTFTPHEKAALTLAGVLDDQGQIETRLQFDLFKKKVDSVTSLSDQKKGALVSLFVSYRTGPPGMLDDRFGAPQYQTGRDLREGTITGGIRIRF